MPVPLPTIGSTVFYTVFSLAIIVMLVIDLIILNQKGSHKVSIKEALGWSLVWVCAAILFATWLGWTLANDPAYGPIVARQKVTEFFTGYVIEKSLSIDNIFVFLMIFSYFKIPLELQRRVLLFGVLGAILLRVIMIIVGAALIARFSWILYFFGIFLVVTGLKMMRPERSEGTSLANSRLLHWLRHHLRITDTLDGERFFIVKAGIRMATPLFLALVMIELSDVVFAVDSVPAIFAVTLDPFIVLTSNIFAILGLRALYFLLVDIAERFYLLRYGLAIVLVFIGSKIFLLNIITIPVLVSLSVVGTVIMASVILSLIRPKPTPL